MRAWRWRSRRGRTGRLSRRVFGRAAGPCRLLPLFLVLLLAFPAAASPEAPFQVTDLPEDSAPFPLPTPLPAQVPAPFTAWPETDGQGFLLVRAGGEEEFVSADEKTGRWIYLSKDLRVEIQRLSARAGGKRLVWFVADIRFRGEEAFRMVSADPGNPSRAQARPEAIALRNRVVYAQNGDLFSWRLYNGEKPGLIIRDGKVLHEDTYTRAVAKIPPLDELALFPDGHVEMRSPGEMGAQGYLDLGARDVLSFGPVLLRGGVRDERLDLSFTHREPRSAIGVISPGHFIGIMVEGRNERSAGAGLRFVADRLLERGCLEAFTLDGGQTAAMIFMGRNVMDPGTYNGFHNTRRQQDILGIGRSEKVGE